MKNLQKTLFLIACFILCTQAVRHVYVKVFEDTASVLDEFDKDATRQEIEQAESIEVLLEKYRPAQQREEELDAALDERLKQKPEEEQNDIRSAYREEHKDDYHKAWQLRSAIQDWETKSKEIRELRIFWLFGLALILAGAVLYLRAPWLGMALIVPGVGEMIWWTSPSFSLGGAVKEYERLLDNKLIFTLLTLLVVLLLWGLRAVLDKRRERAEEA